jgi:1-pyrroline-5-carboxylate dehydrogenase
MLCYLLAGTLPSNPCAPLPLLPCPQLQVRFLARGFSVPGDHPGQTSNGLRWPYGPVALITPFNFPLEIPALQLMGALYMGNKPLLHVDHRVSVC